MVVMSKVETAGLKFAAFLADLLTKFSRRSRQRDEAIADFVATHKRHPTDHEVAILVRESRADKLVGLRTDQVRARQRARLTPEDATILSGLRKENGLYGVKMDSPEPSLQYARITFLNVFQLPAFMRRSPMLSGTAAVAWSSVSLGP